jgi:8-oxo-dGTP pyrophosphatase MutT (NUDIX family)
VTEPSDGFNPASARLAAGALFFDDHGGVLLVKPTYKQGWDIPGGYVEPGESPRTACQRELFEELHITVPIGDLLVVDWAPHPTDGDKLLFVFDGGILDTNAVTLDGQEIGQAAYHQPDQLAAAMPDRLSRRITAAIAAHHAGHTLYLEHGQPVPAVNGSTDPNAAKHRA